MVIMVKKRITTKENIRMTLNLTTSLEERTKAEIKETQIYLGKELVTFLRIAMQQKQQKV